MDPLVEVRRQKKSYPCLLCVALNFFFPDSRKYVTRVDAEFFFALFTLFYGNLVQIMPNQNTTLNFTYFKVYFTGFGTLLADATNNYGYKKSKN